MLKVAAFTGGLNVPSARFRIRQHIKALKSEGVNITEFTASLGMYPPHIQSLRPLWGAATLATRIPSVIRSYRYDLTFLQREMLSTFMTLESWTKQPRVLDVDDAIWLHRNGGFAKKIASSCQAIICGNAFLAEHFSSWNNNVIIIPTAVDTDKYIPSYSTDNHIIGWSGTSGGFKYLYAIEPALNLVLKKKPETKLRIVSDLKPSFKKIPDSNIEFIRWTPENEVTAIQGMSIGIMPLEDSLWERGKCSFKMLTYMACGIPVVVSPVGMNTEVLSHGNIGLGVKTLDDWADALLMLLANAEQRKKIGSNGRLVILNKYSVHTVAPQLAATLLQIVKTY